MKLLYFSPHEFWPVNFGAPLRNYQLAKHLAAHSSVTFVELRRAASGKQLSADDHGLADVVTLKKDRPYAPSKVLRGVLGPTPLTVLNCWSRDSASQLAGLLDSGEFNSVQIEGVHLMKYLPIIQKIPAGPAIVVDWHNIESEGMWRFSRTTGNWAKQIVAERTAVLLERAETWLLDNCATHTVTSERERRKLLAKRPAANVQVIPNGVETGLFTAKKIAEVSSREGPETMKPTLLFVGYMDYHANIDAVIWFCRTAWPEIARNHPNLQFTIVGRDPTPEVRALASERIHVTGTVADVRPFYASAIAAVVPLRSGSGTRLKILEAMAAGVPVVSTQIGAEGIEVENNVHLMVADSVAEIVAAVDKLARSVETRSRLSQAARSLVCRLYDWSIIGGRLYRIHADLAESYSRSAAVPA